MSGEWDEQQKIGDVWMIRQGKDKGKRENTACKRT